MNLQRAAMDQSGNRKAWDRVAHMPTLAAGP